MANYSTLKAAAADVVKTNGSQAITGANLQSVLLSIINSVGGGGYIFKGVATPSTDAGTPDENVFYVGGAGTYANFGTSVTVPVGSICVFKYNGSWAKEQVKMFEGIDDVPTVNSNNLVKSGGVFEQLQKTIKLFDKEFTITKSSTGGQDGAVFNLQRFHRYQVKVDTTNCTNNTGQRIKDKDGNDIVLFAAQAANKIVYYYYVADKDYLSAYYHVYFSGSGGSVTITLSDVSLEKDNSVTQGSDNLVNSGSVFNAINAAVDNYAGKVINKTTTQLVSAFNFKAGKTYYIKNDTAKTVGFRTCSSENYSDKVEGTFYIDANNRYKFIPTLDASYIGLYASSANGNITVWEVAPSNDEVVVGTYNYIGEKIDLQQNKYARSLLFNFSDFGTLTNSINTQAFDIYNNQYLVQGSSVNSQGMVVLLDLVNKSILREVPLTGDLSSCHCNNVQFGNVIQTGDSYPYVYITEDSGENGYFVINITSSGYDVIQKILFTGTALTGQIDWVIDFENSYLYAYAFIDSVNDFSKLLKFNLPSLSNSRVELTDTDVLEEYVITNSIRMNQGCKVIGNYVYAACGLHSTAHPSLFNVIDLDLCRVVSRVDLNWIGEPEGVAFYNGNVIINNNETAANIKYYELIFP